MKLSAEPRLEHVRQRPARLALQQLELQPTEPELADDAAVDLHPAHGGPQEWQCRVLHEPLLDQLQPEPHEAAQPAAEPPGPGDQPQHAAAEQPPAVPHAAAAAAVVGPNAVAEPAAAVVPGAVAVVPGAVAEPSAAAGPSAVAERGAAVGLHGTVGLQHAAGPMDQPRAKEAGEQHRMGVAAVCDLAAAGTGLDEAGTDPGTVAPAPPAGLCGCWEHLGIELPVAACAGTAAAAAPAACVEEEAWDHHGTAGTEGIAGTGIDPYVAAGTGAGRPPSTRAAPPGSSNPHLSQSPVGASCPRTPGG